MACKLTALTEKITGSVSDGDNYTVAVWFKIPTGVQNDGQPVVSLAGGGRNVMYGNTAGFNNDSGAGTGAKTAETWWYCAVVKNGVNTYHYIFEDVSAETVTGMAGDPRYGDPTITTLGVGDFKGAYGTAINNAEYVYLRAWNTNLSTAELNTEKNSTTVVKTANLVYNLPMVSDLTALTGTNPSTAGSNYSFTSNLPTVLAGGGGATLPLPAWHDDSPVVLFQ